MESNLSSIIRIINDNIKFGSEVDIEYVLDLFDKFPVNNAEKQRVWEELDSLDIKRIYPNKLSKNEVLELLTNISSDQKIYKTDLIDWFYKENINRDQQEQIFDILYTSNYSVIDNQKEESNNLSLLIFYLENNIRYGSSLDIDTIFDLFKKYSIPNSKKKFVWKELESLNTKIIDNGVLIEKQVLKFLESIDSENKIYMSKLKKWFNKERIQPIVQKQILEILNSMDYQIVPEETIENTKCKNEPSFDVLDDYDLDELLNSSEFKKEVENSQDTVSKKYNKEYLRDYLTSDSKLKRDNAIENLIKANKNLVISIVKKYSKFSSVSFDQKDMFQAGMIGLMKAAEKFDLKMGTQFSTYATYWIKQSITRSIADLSTTIRIPVHMREKIIKYIKIENDQWYKNGKLMTDEELAKVLSVSKKEITELKTYKNISRLDRLEDLVGPNDDSTIGQFIVDRTTVSPEQFVEQEDLKKEIDLVLNDVLTKKEIFVIKARYGFINGKLYTLETIGKELNVSRERIRQIQAKAIKKLKKAKLLKELYND